MYYNRQVHEFMFCITWLFCIIFWVALLTEYTPIDHAAWLLAIFLSCFATQHGFATYSEARASKHWPRCEVSSFRCSMDSQRDNKGLTYAPQIDCTFYVNEVRWHGTLYDFGGVYGLKYDAEKKMAAINKLNPMVISYNPEDPSINVLYPGPRFTHFLRIIIGPTVITFYILWIMGWFPPAT